MFRLAVLVISASSLVLSTCAFYLPGSAPHDYVEGERVEVFVNALTPMIAVKENAKLVCFSSQHELLLSIKLIIIS